MFGEFFEYVIRWTWPLAALWVAISAAAIWRNADFLRPRLAVVSQSHRGNVAAVIIVVCMAIGVAGVAKASQAEMAYRPDSRLIGGLADAAEPKLEQDKTYLLRRFDPASLGGTAYGTVLELERRGFHLVVESWGQAGVMPHRVRSEAAVDSVLWLVVGDPAIQAFAARPDARLIAEFDPRSASDIARASDLRRQLESGLAAIDRRDLIDALDSQYGQTIVIFFGGLPPDLKQIASELNDLRLQGALFEVPVGSPLFP